MTSVLLSHRFPVRNERQQHAVGTHRDLEVLPVEMTYNPFSLSVSGRQGLTRVISEKMSFEHKDALAASRAFAVVWHGLRVPPCIVHLPTDEPLSVCLNAGGQVTIGGNTQFGIYQRVLENGGEDNDRQIILIFEA